MRKQIAMSLVLMSIAGVASAGPGGWGGWGGGSGPGGDKPPQVSAPEIDPSSAIAAMTLLVGGLAVMRGRRFSNSAK